MFVLQFLIKLIRTFYVVNLNAVAYLYSNTSPYFLLLLPPLAIALLSVVQAYEAEANVIAEFGASTEADFKVNTVLIF